MISGEMKTPSEYIKEIIAAEIEEGEREIEQVLKDSNKKHWPAQELLSTASKGRTAVSMALALLGLKEKNKIDITDKGVELL